MKIIIQIPCLNEELTLRETLADLLYLFGLTGEEIDMLVA